MAPRLSPVLTRLGPVALGLLLASCSGTLEGGTPGGGDGTDGTDSSGNTGKPTSPPAGGGKNPPGGGNTGAAGTGGPVDPEAAAPLPLRRLSRLEYDNTVRDLLGDTTAPGKQLAADTREGHGFLGGARVDTVDAQRLMDAAESVGAAAIARVADLTACSGAAAEPTCAKDVITRFGRRAYRRPLTADEITNLSAYYANVRQSLGHDHKNAMRLVVQVMLQSPSFLYHWEVPAPATGSAPVRLGPHELASRLSYFLWASMPDDALFAAADGNALETPAQVEAQARRMLKDRKAEDAIASFHLQWLEIENVAALEKNVPELSSATARAAAGEARAFITDLLLGKGDGKLASLFTSRSTFMDADLAKLYGVTGVTGTTLQQKELPAKQRAGVLTQTGFLATHAAGRDSHPVKRGLVVFERVLCGTKPPPAQNVPDPDPPAANVTTRERFAKHSTTPGCVECHKLFDDYGFAFESYDGLGRYREKEGNKTVDAAGQITTGGETFKFANALELSQALGASEQARACFARQWTRFALGRADGAADAASFGAAKKTFSDKDHDIRELIVALATTRSFLYRAPSAGEGTP